MPPDRRWSALCGATLLGIALLPCVGRADGFPVTLDNCGTPEIFDRPAARAVANDVNIVETLLTLGVQDRMAGYAGLNRKQVAPALRDRLAGLPELARQYPSLELLLGARADFYIAGWGYGMRLGGEITPEILGRYGIKSYAIRESCIRLGARPDITIDDLYRDVLAIGRAFGVSARAAALIDEFRRRLVAVDRALAGPRSMPRAFVYDSGDDAPLTAGRYAMPTALLAAAGARNVMDDITASWTRVGWEAVVRRDPELIVVIDYGPVPAASKIAFLEAMPALAAVAAVRDRRFVVLDYDAATPGVRNIDAIESLARAIHPERF
jgi:iron complex transport system substrate-binding protein